MSKSKNTGRLNTEKDLARIMEEINKQGFETEDEINDFLKTLQGRSLDDLPDRTDNKGRSQDLVYKAYELPITKGKKLIKEALELDSNNADAYNYLASIQKDVNKAIQYYERAIKAGEKSLGKKFLKEEKGHFWGFVETRPYMRAKAGLADCFYATREIEKSIEIYEEMLELNPNDNQGVRYMLSTLLLGQSDLTKFEKFIKQNEDEDCAVWNYNNALYSFKKWGQTTKSNKILSQAYKSNNFVIDFLLGLKELPENQPQYIGRGDENEAISYVYDAWILWRDTKGAFEWIHNFKQKRRNIN